jgi:transcriptional regulator with XRE-family HTH domain
MEDNMNFQERIQQIRKEKGFSQEDLAEKIGVSRQAVAKWEAGLTYPEVDNLIAISNLFKISIDSLLKSEEDDCSNFQPKVKKVLSEDLIDFLCRAKRETYAANGTKIASSRPSSYDYQYTEGDCTYQDSYFGGEKFIGEEVLYHKEIPVFSMNYCGRTLDESFSGAFLKEVLLLVPKDYPFRGPFVHQNGDYSYHCIVSGDVEWFQGYEEIFFLNNKVFECNFHGGIIQ